MNRTYSSENTGADMAKMVGTIPAMSGMPGRQNASQVRPAETPACQTGPEQGQKALAAAASAANES